MVSAKLKLNTSPEQFQALRRMSLAYRDGLNAISRYAYAHGKTSSNQSLHRGMYAELRARYRLPSQLACSAQRQVAATYKGLWTKVKKNAQARLAGITKKRHKGLDQAPKFGSPTVQYTYERDYTFKPQHQVSLGTLEGRITLSYQGYEKHVALLHHGARIGAASLWYDQHKKCFYLLVSLEVEVASPLFESHKDVVGVDVGIRYLAVTSTSTGEPTFHEGKRVSHQANHYARLRKRLQQKGTRNATRRLRRIAQRERRLKQQADLVGARNITMRTLLLRQDWGKTGYLSVSPDASDKEAKAARLARYAELRWSPDASPSPSRGRGN